MVSAFVPLMSNFFHTSTGNLQIMAENTDDSSKLEV